MIQPPEHFGADSFSATATTRSFKLGDKMQRFFFNVRDGDDFIEDPEGSVLQDREAAIVEAKAVARELLVAEISSGATPDGRLVEVVDQTRIVIAVIPVRSILSDP